MIVNGVTISKDKNKFQIGMGLKLIKKLLDLQVQRDLHYQMLKNTGVD